MKNLTKIKLIRSVIASKDYSDKDKLRLIKNLIDETLPSITSPETSQFLNDTKKEVGGSQINQADQLINKLPKKIANRVRELYDKNLKYENLPEIIETGFVWEETTEKDQYWYDLITLLIYYTKLPQPYQDQAIKNIDISFKGKNKKVIIESLKQAILWGFFWELTPEKGQYWYELHKSL